MYTVYVYVYIDWKSRSASNWIRCGHVFCFFESVQRPSKTSISISSNVISVLLPAMFAIATFDRVSSELL